MSRRTNSHIYCPQQIRATSACFGLTQGDLESEHKTPFLSSVFPIIFFLPIDLRLTCICVVIGTTRYLCRRFLFFMILLYRRLPGGSVKKIPITLYHRSLNSWRTRDDILPGPSTSGFHRPGKHCTRGGRGGNLSMVRGGGVVSSWKVILKGKRE